MRRTRAVGAALLAGLILAALFAPFLTPHNPQRQFTDYENAPPMRPHIIASDGRIVWPFVRPLKLVDRLELALAEDLVDEPLDKALVLIVVHVERTAGRLPRTLLG